jgi:hypothetical protein
LGRSLKASVVTKNKFVKTDCWNARFVMDATGVGPVARTLATGNNGNSHGRGLAVAFETHDIAGYN